MNIVHRYIVWEGHFRGRRYSEMHIISRDNKPICGIWKPESAEHETIWKGRPEKHALCQDCRRKRVKFEQVEKLRTRRAI